jgi:hypothetical protein
MEAECVPSATVSVPLDALLKYCLVARRRWQRQSFRDGGQRKMLIDPMDPRRRQQPPQFLNSRLCGARTKSGKSCRAPAAKKGRCRLRGGASGSGGPAGERTKAAMAERQKFSTLLKMLRAGLT